LLQAGQSGVISWWDETLCVIQTGIKAYHASCTKDTRSYPVEGAEHGDDHLPFTSTGLRMGRSCTSTCPLCLHSHVMG